MFPAALIQKFVFFFQSHLSYCKLLMSLFLMSLQLLTNSTSVSGTFTRWQRTPSRRWRKTAWRELWPSHSILSTAARPQVTAQTQDQNNIQCPQYSIKGLFKTVTPFSQWIKWENQIKSYYHHTQSATHFQPLSVSVSKAAETASLFIQLNKNQFLKFVKTKSK